MTERIPLVFYQVGRVERVERLPKGGRQYQWRAGYSLRSDGQSYPWVTRREAIAEAKAAGTKASFRKGDMYR